MNYKLALAALSLLSIVTFAPEEASAQAAYQSQGATGTFGRSSYLTNNLGRADAQRTQNQSLPRLPSAAGLGGLTRVLGPRGRNGLPPTRLDSFVASSGYDFHIYGDEGVTLPPMSEFTPASRIQRGIERSGSAQGLSTGHGSNLAPGMGGDEWVDYEKLSRSGPNGGNNVNWRNAVNSFGLPRADMNRHYGTFGAMGSTDNNSQPFQMPTQTTPHNSNSGGGFGFSFP